MHLTLADDLRRNFPEASSSSSFPEPSLESRLIQSIPRAFLRTDAEVSGICPKNIAFACHVPPSATSAPATCQFPGPATSADATCFIPPPATSAFAGSHVPGYARSAGREGGYGGAMGGGEEGGTGGVTGDSTWQVPAFATSAGDTCHAAGGATCQHEPVAPKTVGTTAVVTLIGPNQVVVGNCGDSRAVLSRGGEAIPLSVDHRPDREDEAQRVEAAGGKVIFHNGYRVLGILAMSRAIGDRCLKPFVIPDPEVKCIRRSKDDECIIMASDGLWDVISNEEACNIARRCLSAKKVLPPILDSRSPTAGQHPQAATAAALLTKMALARNSTDNITVIVIDLRSSGEDL